MSGRMVSPAGATYASQLRDVDISNAGAGTDLYLLRYEDTSGKIKLVDPSTVGGGATPGGSSTHVQFNDGGSALGGDSGFTYDSSGTATLSTALVVGASGAGALTVERGANSYIHQMYSSSTLRSQLDGRGQQSWYLNSGAAEVGLIEYSTPGGRPGIVIYTGSNYDENRFNIVNRATSFGFGFDADYGTFSDALSIRKTTGRIGLKTLNPTAGLDIPDSTGSQAAVRIRSGSSPSSPNDGDIWKLSDAFVLHGSTSETSTIVNTLQLRRGSSGTPAGNFGAGLNVQLKSSTTAGQDAGRITWKWTTATHASRASQADFTTYYTSTERTSISIGSNSSAPLLSFFAGSLVAQQAGTGEATGFVAGSGTGVNDDSTFTGNVGSTAYRINDVVKALKNYGLLAA